MQKLISNFLLIIISNIISCKKNSTFNELTTTKPKDDKCWKGEMVYQIYPGGFKDYDGNGVGDFKGIIKKLDYIIVGGDIVRSIANVDRSINKFL